MEGEFRLIQSQIKFLLSDFGVCVGLMIVYFRDKNVKLSLYENFGLAGRELRWIAEVWASRTALWF